VATIAVLLSASLYAQAPAKPPTQTKAPQTKASTEAKSSAALPDARDIIDRHIKAIGGRDAFLAHKSMHGTGTVSVPSSGITGTIELFSAAPNLQVVKISMGGIGEITEGFDGTHGWSVNPVTGPTLKVGKELDQVKLDADFYSDLRDPKTYPEVKTVEKVAFEGRPCYKVALTRIDGSHDVDYYDVETGLRAGVEATRETQMGTITQTIVESGYKKVGKLLWAMLVTTKAMGVEQKIALETVEFDNVQPAVFDLPAAIKTLIK
jgi:hypothetical protein